MLVPGMKITPPEVVVVADTRHPVAIHRPTVIEADIIGRRIRRIELGAEVRVPLRGLPSSLAAVRESREGIRRRQMIADGRRIVDGLDHLFVVGCSFNIIGAPTIVIRGRTPIPRAIGVAIIEYVRILDGRADRDFARARLVECITAVGITAFRVRGARKL